MGDTYGASTIPLQVAPRDGTFPPEGAVGDPLLGYLADVVRTLMQVYAGDAWESVQPGKAIVKTIHTSDPEDGFNEADLPCLYVYRPSRETREAVDTFEYLADDYPIQKSRVAVRWIMDAAPQEIRRARNSISDGIRKVIDRVIEDGRDSAWKVPGDPDAKAATFGSSIAKFCGVISMDLVHAQLDSYVHKMQAPAPTRKYDELKMSFLCEELLVIDPNTVDGSVPTSTMPVQIVAPDQGTGLGDFVLDDVTYD